MSHFETHPILSQLNESDRQLKEVSKIQDALAEHRRVMARDGKLTTIAVGFAGITGLFFMKPLPFYIILGLLVIGLPLVWRHLAKEAREFTMSDAEIEDILKLEPALTGKKPIQTEEDFKG